MTAKQKAAKQLQALLDYKASGKGDRAIDSLIESIQVRYGWVGTKTIEVNTVAKPVRPVYRKGRADIMSLVRPY